ncbi:hypothetical protein COU20_03700 [Candidatus Kaiserbacteria bacterium CG10_big_fil_rev_8_21_14_0_10_59_10]|uniref:Small ribosomal subunit protein uS4 n=1 Tax=Candidatus Kaiserbacteria bacterium CG10_big_fil_rev_8_21_14_0_10_59_10 TaxID=1974612 RepID=A0A2H0U742_9BACT|nr:MAG: hypothetical protein COU20_03700 [Candidatus Kaiserbacteria bacterium CG10_big_fil_rev_8_21_14_0_10_59_10]
MRIDNAVYRAGFVSTRRAARQAVSHGHICINGRRTTTPSAALSVGDALTVREGSRKSPLFAHLSEPVEAAEARTPPAWLSVDAPLMKAEVTSMPTHDATDASLDYQTVFEFYSR